MLLVSWPISILAFFIINENPDFFVNLVKFLTEHLLPQTYRWSNTIVMADMIPSNLICEIFCFPDRGVATPCIPLPSSCLDHILEAWSCSSRFVLWSKHEDKRQCAEETSLLALPSSCTSPRCLPTSQSCLVTVNLWPMHGSISGHLSTNVGTKIHSFLHSRNKLLEMEMGGNSRVTVIKIDI